MKKEYCVRIAVTAFYSTFVEAEDIEEAKMLAEEILASGRLEEDHRVMTVEADRTCGELEDDVE